MTFALSIQSVFVLAFISPTWTAPDVTDLSGTAHQSLDVNLQVKSPILEGTDLELKCLFDAPKGSAVSSVKWYKGIREIFRYEHKPVPQKQVLPFGNLTIDEDRSNVHLLYLKHVPSFMSGKISCEVTLEDPSAKAITKSAKLLVAVPPTEGPALEASIIQFSHSNIIHQKLIANCTSAPSRPAANLTIYINDSPEHVARWSKGERLRIHPEISVNNNLVIRRIELELDLTPKHFVDGKILIKCASTMFGLHDSWSDEYVLGQAVAAKKHNSHFIGSRLRSLGSPLQPGGQVLIPALLLVQRFINW